MSYHEQYCQQTEYSVTQVLLSEYAASKVLAIVYTLTAILLQRMLMLSTMYLRPTVIVVNV